MKEKVIGIFAPANSMKKINPELIALGINHLESLGFRVKFAKNAYAEENYTGGTIAERVADIHELYIDPEITLLMSAYGGYNSNQLLDVLDYDLLKRNPKPIIGYSDITALLNGIYAKTNLEMLHGPAFISFANPTVFNPFVLSFMDIIEDKVDIKLVSPETYASDDWYLKKDFKPREIHNHSGWKMVRPSKATGILIGGNLNTFLTLLGTEYAPNCEGGILLMESTENNPAKFDREITQLRLAGILNQLNGIIVGQFPFGSVLNDEQIVTEILLANTASQKYPILLNANFSHVDPHFTAPIGRKIQLGCDPEPYVIIKSHS